MANSPHPAPPTQGAAPARFLPQREMVAMMAALMALNALAIDAMLPALPAIGASLDVGASNDRQFIISVYLIGLGLGSLLHGPLADRFGRRPVVLCALAGYVVSALVAGLAPTFPLLLAMRLCHGLFGAAMGVVAMAIVRDRSSGDEMARLMSMIFIVFMAVPVIAPTVGQAVLTFASWRWIFLLLAAMGTIMAIWVWHRLPETLDPSDKTPIHVGSLARTWGRIATHRSAGGYVLASGIATGAMFGFLNSSQQIFDKVFGKADIFPIAFACVAGTMAVANFSNSRIVLRFGARRVSQTALLAFIGISLTQWLAAGMGETMITFLVLIALNMSMVGFIGANFSSIAMEPFGHAAGAASSFQNAARTLLSAGIGAGIGQMFDGTTVPLAIGFLTCGIIALLVVLWAERGRLFTRPNPPHRPVPRS